MVYKHIYLGLLSIGPNDNNMLTEGVKTKNYLVRIVTPFVYASKEDAQEGHIIETCPMIDMIRQEDWTRYRLLRLKCDPERRGDWLSEIPDEDVKPCGKKWTRLAPAMGRYPIEKVACSIIAFPDVSMKEEKKDAGHGE